MNPEPSFSVHVDVTNPGQFFACCGLLELSHRLWPGAEGCFENDQFIVRVADTTSETLSELIRAISDVELMQLDLNDDYSSPIGIPSPFNLRLDWWLDEQSGGKQLKVWAGSMRNVRIAQAMQHAFRAMDNHAYKLLFSYERVVFEAGQPEKKVEPFYFDSRRGSNAQSIDIGFTPDTLEMTTMACPTVELLCLIGLQRCRPARTNFNRIFDYFAWSVPLAIPIVSVAVSGMTANTGVRGFRFENAFRTGQKKHKAFLPATSIGVRYE